ncbi:hypothetical protein RvY_00701 [Ramazzottius varieornatus]|uniref:Androglobin domain-containing protein n=1 Tax=Ramazzottius varieornatus TaxID=947166 RepID=A0A1D1UHQ4_RAMVA|nr:hypothetical protein RvY_00701 [Ramazzottius varieornatus]
MSYHGICYVLCHKKTTSQTVCLQLLGSDSYQYSALARKSLIPLLRWWKLNGTVTFTHPPHRDVISVLGLEEDACDKQTRRIFSDAMLHAIYTAIQVCLKEFCTAKIVFVLRVFLGDVITKNPLNLTTAQLAKKDSRVITIPPTPTKAELHYIAKPVEGPPLGKRGKKGGGAETALPSARNKQLNPDNAAKEPAKKEPAKKAREPTEPAINLQQAKGFVYFQLYFQVAKSSHIREARMSGSKRKEQVLRTAQELLDAMLKNEYFFANCFLRTLCRNLPESWLDLKFFYSQEKRFIFKEYSGNFPELPPHTWKLFFRDTFFINEPMAIAFKLTTNVTPCRLSVVDNDTGEVCPTALSHPLPHFYEKNNNGYSVVAEAKAGTVAWRATSWSLKIIEALDPFKHEVTQSDTLLVKFNSPSPATNFLTKELTDYFLPDTSENPTIASIAIKVKGPQSLATICFTTSNSDCLFVLTIFIDGNPIRKEYGRGTAVVPVYPFKAGPGMSEQYQIRVECLEDSWPLDGADWKFIYGEKLKRLAVEYGRDSPVPVQSISPPTKEKGGKKNIKSTSARDKGDKSDKETVEPTSAPSSARKKEEKENASIKTPKEIFDINRPHWNIKLLVDITDTEFEIKRDTEAEENFKAELATAMAVDAGILQRGKEQREDFLKKAANVGFLTPDLPEFPGWVDGSARLRWPAPITRCPLSFDVAGLVAPSGGDGPTGEIDLFVHQNRMAKMCREYEEALANRSAFVKAERTERDQFIRKQDEFLRKLIDTAVGNRRKYVEQREVFKKEFDDVALEEQRRLVAAQASSPVPKADEKHKKAKKG